VSVGYVRVREGEGVIKSIQFQPRKQSQHTRKSIKHLPPNRPINNINHAINYMNNINNLNNNRTTPTTTATTLTTT